jgi:transaldolase
MAKSNDNLKAARELGQSMWLDFIDRDLLLSGKLEELVDAGVGGLTSNPTIFQKAISEGSEYDADLRNLAMQGHDENGIFEGLAVKDIQDAADVLRSVYDTTDGADGFVSLEVNPQLANDTDSTISEAQKLWASVDRPNLLIKVPATPEGIPAIRTLISQGISVNVTLIFSRNSYRAVAGAYIDGLGDYNKRGGRYISRIASVASFFVSRVDSSIDGLLPDGSDLAGKAGVANAKMAYVDFEEIFGGATFKELAEAGARVQRPLWASTSVKNPDYPELMYVDGLIGKDTVNTLPPATLDAFMDHGSPAVTLTQDVDAARDALAGLDSAGVSLDAVTDDLLAAGVSSFTGSFEDLMADIKSKRDGLVDA